MQAPPHTQQRFAAGNGAELNAYACYVLRAPAFAHALWRFRSWILDGAIALAVTVGAIGTAFSHDPSHATRSGWLLVPLALLEAAPLAARRIWPLAVLAVTFAAAAALDLLTGTFFPVGIAIALYSVAAHADRRRGLRLVATCAAVAVALIVHDHALDFGVLTVIAVFAVAWVVGDNLRTRRAYLRALEERAERLERERVEHALRAAAEEQARIARELHDVIAHSVSVMVVQAAAAGDVFDSHPGRAREALAAIESVGRQALAELRHLLGVVRPAAGSADGYEPQPGLGELAALLQRVRSAGLPVDLVVEGERQTLPVGIDLSAYRIVQEALTNTLKHAHDATRADVAVRYAASELVVEVVDDGREPQAPARDGGHGLIGMRERVALYGGELDVGHRPPGGFAVRACFPLEPEVAP